VKSTKQLHDLGQSLWLDNISRELLRSGTLQRYRDEFSVTGLTSNPTIFDLAIRNGNHYDDSIRKKVNKSKSAEELFFELALEDLAEAADLFRPIYDSTNGSDGFVSLEVSPLLAYDTATTVKEAARLHNQSTRPNTLIKIPGTREGVPAIEQSTFEGVPVNVTLLFSRQQYIASAEAYMRGIERRIGEGRDPKVHSVASLFVSRWDKAVIGKAPEHLRNQLGIAVAKQTYAAYRDLLESDRWQKLAKAGALPQRLLWGSTGTKDPSAPDVMYIEALAAPDTINTIPDKTLLAFADHGQVKGLIPRDGGDAEQVLSEFRRAGVDDAALAAQLQKEGAEAFSKSWSDLMECIATKSESLRKAG
jgi:transaldolase